MRNHVRSFCAGLIAGLFFAAAVGILVVPIASLAQQPQFGVRNPTPRQFQWQMVHYIRFTVNFNSCVLVAGTCAVKVGAVPYNSMILRASQQIITSFNSATTDTVSLGTGATGGPSTNLVAAQSVHGAAGGMTSLTVVAANAGITVTGNNVITATSPPGAEGGFDIWAVYVQTGAAPTAGQAVYVLEYIAPNDGLCTTVPLGGTAGAC